MIPASPAAGADSPALVTLPVMTPDVLFIVPPDWFATLPIILPLLSTVPLFVKVPVTFVVLPLLLVYVEPAVFTFKFATVTVLLFTNSPFDSGSATPTSKLFCVNAAFAVV